jgi:NAD(P)-dependent dehydrogenase (short-subunit alcohol dehydrogenase family)
MNFSGKVVIVTGSGEGIGRAAAIAFAQKGARVAIADAAPLKGKETVALIEGSVGEAIFFEVDVSDTFSVRQMVSDVKKTFGTIDILVNNAGIHAQGDVVETSEDTWDKIMAVNLKGVYLCSHHVIPVMFEKGSGVIVNVASEAGMVGIKGQVAYNVSKAGVISLTHSMAVDFAARGIRVNAVSPGTTETPLVLKILDEADNPGEIRKSLEGCRPLNRLGRMDEIAAAIMAMASDELGYATGSVLTIDGGYTAQ